MVFGTILSLSIIAACSVPDDDSKINSKFAEYVVGQKAVVEADNEVYAVFNEKGDLTITSTREVFTEVESSSDTSTTYEKEINGSDVDLIVKLIMVSGKAIGATFEMEIDDVIDGTPVTTKFLDTSMYEGKTLSGADTSTVQGNQQSTPSVNYGWKSGKLGDFVSYDLETGIFLYQHTDGDPTWDFPVRITVDPSTALGMLKIDAGITDDVKFETTP